MPTGCGNPHATGSMVLADSKSWARREPRPCHMPGLVASSNAFTDRRPGSGAHTMVGVAAWSRGFYRLTWVRSGNWGAECPIPQTFWLKRDLLARGFPGWFCRPAVNRGPVTPEFVCLSPCDQLEATVLTRDLASVGWVPPPVGTGGSTGSTAPLFQVYSHDPGVFCCPA